MLHDRSADASRNHGPPLVVLSRKRGWPCPHFIKSGPSPPRTETVGDTPQRHAPRAARVLRVPGHIGGHPVAQERDLPTTRGRADSCTLAKTDCGVARYSGRRSHIGLCQICACGASAFQGGRDGARPSRIQPFGRHAPRAARVLRVPDHVGGHPVAQERDQRRRGMNLPRHRRN